MGAFAAFVSFVMDSVVKGHNILGEGGPNFIGPYDMSHDLIFKDLGKVMDEPSKTPQFTLPCAPSIIFSCLESR